MRHASLGVRITGLEVGLRMVKNLLWAASKTFKQVDSTNEFSSEF